MQDADQSVRAKPHFDFGNPKLLQLSVNLRSYALVGDRFLSLVMVRESRGKSGQTRE